MYNRKPNPNPNPNAGKFAAASAQERVLGKQLADMLGCTFIGAPEKCHYDAVFAKDDVVSVVEFKVRTFPHNRYDSGMIEKDKFNNLLAKLDGNMCHRALYVMFFSDGIALVWNLSKVSPNWFKEDFVKTTMGDRSKKTKTVANLPNSDATLIRMI